MEALSQLLKEGDEEDFACAVWWNSTKTNEIQNHAHQGSAKGKS